MRHTSRFPILALVFAFACGGSSSLDDDGPGGSGGNEGPEIRGGTIDSPEAAEQFFEAVVPELISVLTAAADQLPQFGAAAAKQTPSPDDIVVECPEGGSFTLRAIPFMTPDGMPVNTNVDSCAAEGVILNGELDVTTGGAVLDPLTEEAFYSSSLSGLLDVSGAFAGQIDIDFGFLEWSVPDNPDNTFWEISGTVGGDSFFATSMTGMVDPDPPNDDLSIETGGACNFDDGNIACEAQCVDICSDANLTLQMLSYFCTVDNECECFCIP